MLSLHPSTQEMQNLRQGHDRGMQTLRHGRDRGMQNLRQGLDRRMQFLRQRRDRRMQNLRQGRDRGQTIIRSLYNAIVQPNEQITWKDIIATSLVTVLLCCLIFKSDYDFKGIKRK